VVLVSYPVALVLLTTVSFVVGGHVTTPAIVWGGLCGLSHRRPVCFHPDGVNDIAPSGYDWAEFLRDLEPSPLDAKPEPTGMRRRT